MLTIVSSTSKVALVHVSLQSTPTCAGRGRLRARLLLAPPLRLQAIPAQATDRHAAGAVSCGQWPHVVQPTPVPGVPGVALRGHGCWPHRVGHVVLLLQPCWLPILRVGLLLGVLLQHAFWAGVLHLHTTTMLDGMQQSCWMVCSSHAWWYAAVGTQCPAHGPCCQQLPNSRLQTLLLLLRAAHCFRTSGAHQVTSGQAPPGARQPELAWKLDSTAPADGSGQDPVRARVLAAEHWPSTSPKQCTILCSGHPAQGPPARGAVSVLT